MTPNPLSRIALGDPLGPGCNIAFASCQTGSSGVVRLYTVRFVATSLVTRHVLSVQGRTPPSDPNLPCPRLYTCDAPADVWVCSAGRTAAINDPSHCVTGIEPKAWSEVRSLYR